MEWPAVRDEVVAVLRDALGWNVPAARWDQIREVIDDMATAVASAGPESAGPDEVRRMAEMLELFSPVRVMTRLGEPPDVPVPEAVRERIAELIDALAPAAQPDDRTRRDASWRRLPDRARVARAPLSQGRQRVGLG
ncbi:MAG: CATRA system-associated protein [Streptosporangiaceae bacterium]|jgi:hypothetical protein